MELLSSNGLMNKPIRLLRRIIVLSFATALLVVLVVSLQFYYFIKTPLPVLERGAVFQIAYGTSMRGIANKLYKESLITHPNWFLILVKYSKAWGKLKAGEYLIRPGTTPVTLMNQLLAGKVLQHRLTIVEGWTFEKLIAEMNKASAIDHKLSGLLTDQIMDKLGHKGKNPEGLFLPETYCYSRNTSDIAILKRAFSAMEGKLLALWHNRASNLPFKTPYEALIMASIIERESSIPEEYTEISGVYVRRLQKDMLLQADPTVIYGLGKNYKPPLTLSMLRVPSPYNTYLNKGLPPTPIAMPGLRALTAALHPEPGDALFFVAKPDGKGHIFARNYEEHRENVKEYRDGRDIRNIDRDRRLQQEEAAAAEGAALNGGTAVVPVYIDPNTIPNPDPTIASPDGSTSYQTPSQGQQQPASNAGQNMQLVAPRTNPPLPAGPPASSSPLILTPDAGS